MEIVMRKVSELTPYGLNAKKHDDKQVDNVANSIKRFGWQQPIVIDEQGVVVIGHCRLMAAKKLTLKEVPVTVASGLTEDEIKELRIADNKTNESPWDLGLLAEDIKGLDFDGFDLDFGIGDSASWFDQRARWDDSTDGEDEDYKEFLDKFEAKKTTDDCYTPDNIYEAVANWCASKYGVDKSRFVRPFFPGGDYQHYKYTKDCVVVDNPPFSILAEILAFYSEKGIRFLLFAPALTLFSGRNLDLTYLPVGVGVTYENGANVSTSFITNMDNVTIRSAPDLYAVVEAANDENLKAMHKALPKYSYPDHVVTAAMVQKYSKYGVEWVLPKGKGVRSAGLDSQKDEDKAIFGGGYLISDKAAKERAAAERAAAERAAAKQWRLSDRELDIIRGLGE